MAGPPHTDILGREEFPADLPQRPEPAQVRHAHRSSRHSRSGHHSEKSSVHAHEAHHPSVSSAGGTYRTDASIDLEKQALGEHEKDRHNSWSPHSSIRASREARRSHPHPSIYQVGRGTDSSPHHQTIRHIDDDGEVTTEKVVADGSRPLKLLLYFLTLLPLVSFAISIWALLVTIFATFFHPFRLIFNRERSLSQVILDLLEPALSFHLERIGAFRQAAAELQLPQTILVLTSSAILSIGVMIWAMVLGVFWIFAAIIGDPDGLDGRSDGRDLIKTTRQNWEDWLRLSVRPELRS